MKCSQARAFQAPLLQPEQINYSVQFIPRERQTTVKGKGGKVSNKGPIFCLLLLVASKVTY